MPNLRQLYPNKAAVEAAFPIADLWVELERVLNTEDIDDLGYTTTTKPQLLIDRTQRMAEAFNSTSPRYDLFERIRRKSNLEMYFPLGVSSSLMKSWNLAARYILRMYGYRPR